MHSNKSQEIKTLYSVLARIDNEKDMELFLEDLCTIQELISISQRLRVASLLVDGKSYTEVKEITGVSSTTISRVNRCLTYGDGGYKLATEIAKGE